MSELILHRTRERAGAVKEIVKVWEPTGVVTIQQGDQQIHLPHLEAARLCFNALLGIAPEVLNEEFAQSVAHGETLAVGLLTGGTLILSTPDQGQTS